MTAAVVFVVIGLTAAYAIVRRRRRTIRLEAGQAGRAVIAANLAASRRR